MTDESSHTDALRLLRVLALTVFVGLGGVGLLNVLVDPTDVWSVRLLEPLVRTSRATKVELLRGHAASPPATLILGSSRVMKFEPEAVARHTSAPVFNAAVNSAMTEDYLAMARYVLLDLKYPVRHIVLGVDVEAWSDGRPVDARLLSTRALARQLDTSWVDGVARVFGRVSETLSLHRLHRSLESLKYWIRGYPELSSRYEPDGLLVYLKWEAQQREGTFDADALLQRTKTKYVRRMEGFTKLDPERRAHYEALVRLCKERGVALTVFMTPLHPELEAHLSETVEGYLSLQAQVNGYLSEHALLQGYRYVDTRDIQAFGGSEGAYFDGAHPTVENTRKHIRHLFGARTDAL